MPEYKRIPGVQTLFQDFEIQVLKEHFQCKNMDDLILAGKRYESLFFMFDPEGRQYDMVPGEDLRLALALADEYAFENLTETSQPLKRRYSERPKRGPGRTRKEPLPEDISVKFDEARKLVSTNEAAAQRLIALGTIPTTQKSRKAKTILRYIQKAEKQRLEEEQHQRYWEPDEVFKDFAPPPPDNLK